MTAISGISVAALTVTDIDRSVAWYKEVLGIDELMREDHNGESPGYAVLMGLPDWSALVALHHHPSNGGETFSETRTGLDHIGFKLADRAAASTWATWASATPPWSRCCAACGPTWGPSWSTAWSTAPPPPCGRS